MEQAELEQIIEKARIDRISNLDLTNKQLTTLPESIGGLRDLTSLILRDNQLTIIPKNIDYLINLKNLDLSENNLNNLPSSINNLFNLENLNLRANNRLRVLPIEVTNVVSLKELNLSYTGLTNLTEEIGNLKNLTKLCLNNNQISDLPISINKLINLTGINLANNPLSDLSILQSLSNLKLVRFFNVYLPKRYWAKFSNWRSEWLLDEDNSAIRHLLIEQLGYERICDELNANTLDTWSEYTLLKIDKVETIYEEEGDEPIDREPMILLKMTCPSTQHIHILRVPPEMTSAEAAITWVNHGIHPDRFAIQT